MTTMQGHRWSADVKKTSTLPHVKGSKSPLDKSGFFFGVNSTSGSQMSFLGSNQSAAPHMSFFWGSNHSCAPDVGLTLEYKYEQH